MCKAFEEVRAESRAEGRAEGRQEEKLNNLKAMMETMNWNPLQAMNALKVPEEDQQKYLKLLKQ